jgi:hypothetical protein
MEFKDPFNFIEVMNYSKILCIGFRLSLEIYNIEEDPMAPKLIKSILNNYGDIT